MKRLTVVAGLLSCGFIVAGCASAPIAYYTLMPASVATHAPAVAASVAPVRFDLLPVDLPEMLDRPQMVVRQGAAGVSVLDRVRWASPLSDELRAALSAGLATPTSAAPSGSASAASAGAPVWRVKVNVRRIDAWPGQQVLLEADWTARATGEGAQRLACSSRVAQPAPTDYAGLAAAHQAAVQRLSRDIDRAVRQQAC